MHEAAQLAHQAAMKLFRSHEAPPETVDRTLFSEYFAGLSLPDVRRPLLAGVRRSGLGLRLGLRLMSAAD